MREVERITGRPFLNHLDRKAAEYDLIRMSLDGDMHTPEHRATLLDGLVGRQAAHSTATSQRRAP